MVKKRRFQELPMTLIKGRFCSVSDDSCSFLFEKEISILAHSVNRLLDDGESNSVLLIGPSGSGKSQCLRSVLTKIEESSSIKSLNGKTKYKRTLLSVNLNGFLLTDDRKALREISRQLNVAVDNLKDESDGEDEELDVENASFDQNFNTILSAVAESEKVAILFILEEFDQFALHRNQHLLYNLLDASQKKNPPVLVVGVTCKLDVKELLEKRVRSRFSHRQIEFLNDWNFERYLLAVKALLQVSCDSGQQEAVKWNQQIEELCDHAAVNRILERTFSLNRSLQKLKLLLICVVSQLSTEHMTSISPTMFEEAAAAFYMGSVTATLQGLSVLELTLIVAMKNVMQKLECDSVNFATIFKEYEFFARRKYGSALPRAVVMKVFERLQLLELVLPVHKAVIRSSEQKEWQQMRLQISINDVCSAIDCCTCPVSLREWTKNPMLNNNN